MDDFYGVNPVPTHPITLSDEPVDFLEARPGPPPPSEVRAQPKQVEDVSLSSAPDKAPPPTPAKITEMIRNDEAHAAVGIREAENELKQIQENQKKQYAAMAAGAAFTFVPAAAEAFLESKGIPANGQVMAALRAAPSVLMGASLGDRFGRSESRVKNILGGATVGAAGSQAIGYAAENVDVPGFEQGANLVDDFAFLGGGLAKTAFGAIRRFIRA